MDQNPKLKGSNIIDCIPQTGKCPIGCRSCFYNNGFYRTLDKPLIPSLKEAEGKIVRVNSGHDSNINKKHVIETTAKFKDKFYNTSIENFDFPAPVVFTCNRNENEPPILSSKDLSNLMAVRVKTSAWNLHFVDNAVEYYTSREIPVILTYMRYGYMMDTALVPYIYEYRMSIKNYYYIINPSVRKFIENLYKNNKLVYHCPGDPKTKLCKYCRNCEILYGKFIIGK